MVRCCFWNLLIFRLKNRSKFWSSSVFTRPTCPSALFSLPLHLTSSRDIRRLRAQIPLLSASDRDYDRFDRVAADAHAHALVFHNPQWHAFAVAWNEIIEALRAGDLISNGERDLLLFRFFSASALTSSSSSSSSSSSFSDSRAYYLPLFLTAGTVDNALRKMGAQASAFRALPPDSVGPEAELHRNFELYWLRRDDDVSSSSFGSSSGLGNSSFGSGLDGNGSGTIKHGRALTREAITELWDLTLWLVLRCAARADWVIDKSIFATNNGPDIGKSAQTKQNWCREKISDHFYRFFFSWRNLKFGNFSVSLLTPFWPF